MENNKLRNNVEVCTIESECDEVRLLLPFRRHLYKFVSLEFSRVVRSASKHIASHSPFTCLMLRLHDDATPLSPFHNYKPCVGKTEHECLMFVLTRTYNASFVKNNLFVMSRVPLAIKDTSSSWNNITLSRDIPTHRETQLQVFIEMQICSLADEIIYTDNMKKLIGTGGHRPCGKCF